MALSIYHYTGSVDSPVSRGRLRDVSNLRILWEIPGGVQAIEFDYGCNPAIAYNFYKEHVGSRIVVADQFFDRPVAEGWVYGIALASFGARILVRGPWYRHFDQFDDTDYPLAQTSSAVIKSSLTNFVPVVSTNQDNIAETSFTLNATGTWGLSEYGLYPGDVITKLAAMSNSSLKQWNYWLRSARFSGLLPERPIPYFEEQVNDGTFDWQINQSDLTREGVTTERNIDELANNVLVIYRDIPNGEQILTAWSADTTSQSGFWLREIVLSGGEMVPTGATQYRDLMLAKYKDPMLKRQMTITSPYIKNNGNSRWPLWYPIKQGGGYLRINDVFADAQIFDESWDRKRIGQIMTAEYDDNSYSLRISLDTQDDRSDVLLAQMAAFL